jgi:hypothetical protein
MKALLKRPMMRGLALALALISLPATTRANVYATNLRLNGATTNVVVGAGQNVSIGYLLNEAASAGVTIRIFTGTNVVRTLAVGGGNPGTSRGTNTVTWNGKDDVGNPAPGGTYAFSVTAAAAGYPVWTQTTYDTNSGNQVHTPRGLAVDQNTNSLYYGRIYVANSYPGATTTNTADLLGFQKLNADASPAAEGVFSTGGYLWSGNFGESPFKARVGADDRFYAEDAGGNGIVMSWDQQITANSMTNVMRNDNNAAGSLFSAFFVTGSGTDRKMWMTDSIPGGRGVVRWDFQPDGALAMNDQGTNVIPMTATNDLNNPPFDVAVDKDGKIYVVCPPFLDSQYRLMRFPAYTDTPLTNADWKVATTTAYDNTYVYAVAVNPAATHVAVAPNETGAVGIFDAGTGSTVTNLSASGKTAASVAWDNVGNAYVGFEGNTSSDAPVWQAWSPPGANQATTVGLGTIQVLESPSISGQPQSRTNLVGTDAGFTVVASGEAPLIYQWRFNGSDLGGATTSALTVQGVQTTNAGSYDVVITNVAGAVTSFVATLTVWVPPSISEQPQSRTNQAGTDASFAVTASGTPPLTYQWRFNGSNLEGATTNTLTLSGVQSTNAGSYDVVVTNLAGGTTSTLATLSVTLPSPAQPSITSITPTGSNFRIIFTGPASDPPSVYSVLSGSDATVVTNVTPATITGSNGLFQAIVAANGPKQFYRIRRSTTPVPLPQPYITSIVATGSNFKITFIGPAGDPPSVYSVLSGSVVTAVTNVTPAIITGSNGVYEAIVPANGPKQFYRILRSTAPVAPPPLITSIVPSGSDFKINFTGPSSDPPTAYAVLSGSVATVVTNVTSATITGSNGVYQATVAASGPKQFYRISRSVTP